MKIITVSLSANDSDHAADMLEAVANRLRGLSRDSKSFVVRDPGTGAEMGRVMVKEDDS